MPAAIEFRVEPDGEDFVCQTECDDPAAERQHVGVVVGAREPRGVEVVAQGRADAGDFVGGDLLALPAASDHDAAVGTPVRDGAPDGQTNRRIVDRRVTVGPVIVDGVAQALQRDLEMFFQQESRVIGADRDAHGC